jgi:tetratricopeptide (TPR) repeat protein
MNKKNLLLTLLFMACYATVARAAYEDVGVGARVTGMSNAYTAVADDVYSVYYNPAGLATLERPMLATSYSKLLGGLSDNSNLQNSFIAYEQPIKNGDQGVVGGAWNYFTLDSLYRETSLYGTYARALRQDFFVGGSLKYLNRSVGGVAAANQPLNATGQVVPGAVDPVLQRSSKSNMDLDVGALYRLRPRWTLGLAIQHLTEPNVAFDGSDKLGRNVKLGGSYKTPFSTLSTDLGFIKAPDGSMDKSVSFAAEKWLPTLMHGSFGVRGGLAVGSRSYRQLSAGVSYKVYKMQFDYGFAMPLGGISKTYGTHRMGLTYHFGRPRAAQPAFGEAVLENLRELADVGTPEFKYQMEDLALFKRTAIEEFLRQAKVDVGAGRFADALEKLQQALSMKPNDAKISASLDRLQAAAAIFPEVKDFATDAAQAALYEGILEYLIGSDKQAIRKLAYAQSIAPSDERIETMLQMLEAKAGVIRDASLPVAAPKAAPTMGAEKVVGGTLALMEVALRERDWEKVIKFAGQVLELDPANVQAYKRLGAAYYAQKRYPEALKALRSAYKLEEDSDQKKSLRSYIEALQTLMERRARESVTPKQPRAQEKPLRTPQEIERLYEAGVDLYAQGRLSEAATLFTRILELEPGNVSARRALDRIQAEMLQGEKR